MKKTLFSLVVLAVIAAGIIGCGKKEGELTNSQINGAGASFPAPLYTKWFSEYSKLNAGVKINYQSIGSGGGVKQLTEGTVDFGASDSPMTEEELKNAETKNNTKVIHIPATIGAVVISYNLPELTKPLNLSGEVIAEIYLGVIKKWNDPKIAKLNEGVSLPDKEIITVFRTDGSGTTFIFTDYLASISETWKKDVGVSKTVKFPVGQGGKGNEGVAGVVKQMPYSIGYVELIYAIQNKLGYANIKSADGEFVTPSLESVTKAAEVSLPNMPESLTSSIVNPKGAGAYPISSYTYLLLFESGKDAGKQKTIVDFIKWALGDGQKFAKELGYSPLPADVSKKALEKLEKIK